MPQDPKVLSGPTCLAVNGPSSKSLKNPIRPWSPLPLVASNRTLAHHGAMSHSSHKRSRPGSSPKIVFGLGNEVIHLLLTPYFFIWFVE
jgi:hypothetical protein